LAAVRKMNFTKSTSELFGNNSTDINEDALFLKLLELSKQIVKMGIHPKKFFFNFSNFSEFKVMFQNIQ
jgi:hypothetical protein